MRTKILENSLNFAIKDLKNHPEPFKHWCFVINNNQIVEIGKNRSGVPIYTNFGYSRKSKIHAEPDAYRKAKGLIKLEYKIINIRLNRQGELRNSKPCNGCLKFLHFTGCLEAWYSTNEFGFQKIKIN